MTRPNLCKFMHIFLDQTRMAYRSGGQGMVVGGHFVACQFIKELSSPTFRSTSEIPLPIFWFTSAASSTLSGREVTCAVVFLGDT